MYGIGRCVSALLIQRGGAMEPKRILIVEDDSIVAAHLQKMLAWMGYKIAALVATGEAAIVAIDTKQPDLILMDIQLAGENRGPYL